MHEWFSILISSLVIAAFLCIMCFCGGCEKKQAAKSTPPTSYTKTFADGPVTVTLRLGRQIARVAEPVDFTLEAHTPAKVKITFPDLGKAKTWGAASVHDVEVVADLPAADGEARVWLYRGRVESYGSGVVTLPSLTIDYTDRRKGDTPTVGKVVTKPIELRIDSSLPAKVDPKSFNSLRDIKAVADLPARKDYRRYWYAAAGAGGLVALILLVWLLKRVKLHRQLKAHLWATRQLNQLADENLIASGLVEEYYIRLTTIVRQYIERRFALPASKYTTPEFLVSIREHPAIGETQRLHLDSLLSSADLVKFARFTPAIPEITATMDTAREFVQATAVRSAEELQREKQVARGEAHSEEVAA